MLNIILAAVIGIATGLPLFLLGYYWGYGKGFDAGCCLGEQTLKEFHTDVLQELETLVKT